jgi:hypothetical protein
MKPFNFRLFGGTVLYTALVIGVVEYRALRECLVNCISCCYF